MLDHDSIEVTALKRIDRDALLLVAWGELSYAEVAEVLAVTFHPELGADTRLHELFVAICANGSTDAP